MGAGRRLLTYGQRVQRSVFELWLDPDEVRDVRREVGPHLGVLDRFELFPIDDRGARCRVSWQREPTYGDSVLLL